uniref:Secreted protein n=1 Tax=Globodera pallida TaxID=36090 RepID=A0A183CBR6_GLOPA
MAVVFILMLSLATLEAQEKEENSKDKIRTFLAVPKCFILPEWESSIFDYWIEIIKMNTEKSQKPIFGVAIYKEKYDEAKSEDSKENAFELSRESYKILKQLNDQKFSIYESSNLLRATFNEGYSPRRKLQKI